jgi:hypothetical protein
VSKVDEYVRLLPVCGACIWFGKMGAGGAVMEDRDEAVLRSLKPGLWTLSADSGDDADMVCGGGGMAGWIVRRGASGAICWVVGIVGAMLVGAEVGCEKLWLRRLSQFELGFQVPFVLLVW